MLLIALFRCSSATLSDAGSGDPTARMDRGPARSDAEEKLRTTRQCEQCMLYKVELDGVDLHEAKLQRASVQGSMRHADLRGADLTEASLSVDLEGADLRGARLDGTIVRFSRFAGARLEQTDLRTVFDPPGADWSGARMQGANLAGRSFIGQAGVRHQTPRGGYLSVPVGGTSLRGADLRDANLRDVLFSSCDLRDVDFRGADLTGAKLPTDADDLVGANFSGAKGPLGLVCAAGSIGRCNPTGTPTELRAAKRRAKHLCAPGWPCP